MPEEGERDVKVARLDDPGSGAEGAALPGRECLAHALREREAAEETQAFMRGHRSGVGHTDSCRFCDKRRLAR